MPKIVLVHRLQVAILLDAGEAEFVARTLSCFYGQCDVIPVGGIPVDARSPLEKAKARALVNFAHAVVN